MAESTLLARCSQNGAQSWTLCIRSWYDGIERTQSARCSFLTSRDEERAVNGE